MRDGRVGCVFYNDKDNRWQIDWQIQIMQNIRILSNHECAWLAHQCTFRKKNARFNISQFHMIKINHKVQMIIDIAAFTTKELLYRHLTIVTVSKYYRFHDKNFLGNHKSMPSHYIIEFPESNGHGANVGPSWVLSAQVGPMLAPWTLLSGYWCK